MISWTDLFSNKVFGFVWWLSSCDQLKLTRINCRIRRSVQTAIVASPESDMSLYARYTQISILSYMLTPRITPTDIVVEFAGFDRINVIQISTFMIEVRGRALITSVLPVPSARKYTALELASAFDAAMNQTISERTLLIFLETPLAYPLDEARVREAFIVASKKNWLRVVGALLKGAFLKQINGAVLRTAFFEAVKLGYLEMVRFLSPHLTDQDLGDAVKLAVTCPNAKVLFYLTEEPLLKRIQPLALKDATREATLFCKGTDVELHLLRIHQKSCICAIM